MKEKIYVHLLIISILVSCNDIANKDKNNVKKTDEMIQNISENQRLKLNIKLASVLHEEWRSNRLLADGSYEPRLKNTTDEIWIKNNNSDQVDIANTSFINLPHDWQEENLSASIVAMNEVLSAYENKVSLESTFIEEASEKVHIEWLKRNSEWAQENQKLPYAQLSEEEKDKDRLQVIKAIEVFKQGF